MKGVYWSLRIGIVFMVLILQGFCWPWLSPAAGYVMTPSDRDLFEGIATDDVRRVESAISMGASVNEARNNYGDSPLMAAGSRGNLDVVKALVARGADINLPVSTGLTSTNALARSTGNIMVLMYLIANGGNIHGDDMVDPLLLEVARSSSVMVARYLLLKGADVNKTGRNGWSALMSAVICCQNSRGNMEMVRLLVEWGATVDHRDADGQTALMKTTDRHIAAYLVEKGADVNAVDARGNTVLSRVLETSSLKEPEIAALAEFLLEKSARPDMLNGDKRTPLMIAVWRGNWEVARMLLDKGAAVDAPDPMGITALAVAAESHQTDMIKLCLDWGADANLRDYFGVTPLIHLFNGLPCDTLGDDARRATDLLLEAGADPNLTDSDGTTVLDLLRDKGCSDEVLEYLQKNAAAAPSRPPAPAPAPAPAVDTPRQPTEPAAVTSPPSELPRALPAPSSAPETATTEPPPEPRVSRRTTRKVWADHRVDQLGFNDRKFFLAMARDDYQAMDDALSQGVDVNQQSQYLPEGTFLMHAVRNHDVRLTAYLLTKGADANLKDLAGQTPLAAAVGNRTCIKLLFGKGAELNTLSPSEEVEETPLAKAVRTGEIDSARLLISLGADVNRRDSTGSPPLMLALFLPDLALARLLVESGADVNAEVPGEWTTPLMNAVVANSRQMVEFLVSVGADVNGKNIRGYSPLLLAVELADRSIIALLLAKGADINLPGYGGTTPLIESIMLNRGLKIVEFLLARGAEVNAGDDNGITSLIIAVIRGQTDVIRLLLARGADPNQADRQGKTPLAYAQERSNTEVEAILADAAGILATPASADAVKQQLRPEQLLAQAVRDGDLDAVRQILDSGVRVTVRDEETRRPLMALAVESGNRDMVDLLLARGADLNDAAGTSNLHVAAKAGQKAMVEYLLTRGARVSILAEGGASPLHEAVRLACVAELGAAMDPARKQRAELFREIVQLLLDGGADANAGTLETVDLGEDSLWNPLHLAAYLGSPAMIELLLRTAQVDSRTAEGNTPLHLAVLTLSGASVTEVVDLLLARGANPNDKNNKGNTVLQEAMTWWDSWPGWGTETRDGATFPRWYILVEKLLEGGVSLREAGEYGSYPLHPAAESGLTDLAGLLLDHGAKVNVTDRDGITPLYVAVRQNRTEMVRLLLRKGANRNPENREGKTPLDEARRQRQDGNPEAAEIEELLLASGAEPGHGE